MKKGNCYIQINFFKFIIFDFGLFGGVKEVMRDF